ncbi:nickel/cobalt transporter [Erwinia tasmaniensis]|uniref:nickel/cobalt transporter n=1 Tax=Erwinia tasmaniensis TaxID=338565 RepID=UPI003A4DCB57
MPLKSPLPRSLRGGSSAWPPLLLILAFTGIALVVWQHWSQILLQSIQWQKMLHLQMTTLLQQVASHPRQAGLSLMGFSLAYGVLHALGPGHGKVVIAAFLATHPTRVKTSLKLTLAASLAQGCVAIMLVTVLLGALKLSSRQLHISSYWLEKGSYLLVMGLGLWLCWRAAAALWQARRGRPLYRRMMPAGDHPAGILPAGQHTLMQRTAATRSGQQTISPSHPVRCGCGHLHVPDAAQLEKAVSLKTQTMVVLSMGLRPCSGAIMMLLFSKVTGVYLWGILSALTMAAGTAFTVSAMALLVQTSRALAVKLSRKGAPAGWKRAGRPVLSLAGGMLLVLMGGVLWLSAQPVMSGGIRPMFLH